MTPPKRKPVRVRPDKPMVQVHLVPARLLGWRLKVEGRSVGTFVTKAEAEQVGTYLSRLLSPATFKVHGRNGVIQEESTFSRADDPRETPG